MRRASGSGPLLQHKLSSGHKAGLAGMVLFVVLVTLFRSFSSSSSSSSSSSTSTHHSLDFLRARTKPSPSSSRERITLQTPTHVCQTWSEKAYLWAKRNSRLTKDIAMKKVARPPREGWAWQLEVTNDVNFGSLGLHNFDARYEYGSKLADERAKREGYCRVQFPSVPRTGSTWFRLLFEVVTGRPTAATWPEGATHDPERHYFISHDPCGSHPNPMEGRPAPDEDDGRFCRNVKVPGPGDAVLVKSHTPFYPSWDMVNLQHEATCAVLLIVRNPLDGHHALSRYNPEAPKLRDYMVSWTAHILYWINEASDVPLLVVRYEDLLYDTAGTMTRIMKNLPGGWRWSPQDLETAVRELGPKRPFREKCGSNLKEYTPEEVDVVFKHFGNIMGNLGYLLRNEEESFLGPM